MSFRIGLTPATARSWQLAAADGQLGAVVKAYREWQLCGDREFLERLWPSLRRAPIIDMAVAAAAAARPAVPTTRMWTAGMNMTMCVPATVSSRAS